MTEALRLDGSMFEGRTLTVNRATLRGADNQINKKDKSWVTVPTQPKNNRTSNNKTSTNVNNNSSNLNGRKSWDQWAGPSGPSK